MKLIFLFVIFALAVVGIGAYLGPDDLSGCPTRPTGENRCQSSDAIVAISGGDTAARAGEAITLYQNGWAPRLIFSGAAQDETGPSNAEVMRQMALEAGVPGDDIMIEEGSRTTQQNAKKTRSLLSDDSVSSLILVTSAYHQRRASLEFRHAFGNIQVRNHPVKVDSQWSWLWWTSPRGWYLTMGEIAKIAVSYAVRLLP